MVAKHLFEGQVLKETSAHNNGCQIDNCSKMQFVKETSLQGESFKEIFVLRKLLYNENEDIILMDFSLFILKKDCVNS